MYLSAFPCLQRARFTADSSGALRAHVNRKDTLFRRWLKPPLPRREGTQEGMGEMWSEVELRGGVGGTTAAIIARYPMEIGEADELNEGLSGNGTRGARSCI